MTKRALITGITGQDGSYLAELLLEKGYQVHGVVRRVAMEDAEHKLLRIQHLLGKITLHAANVESYPSLDRVVQDVKPDEFYHLAAQSFVGTSFDDEFSTITTNISGTHHSLAVLKQKAPQCRFYFAATSEIFGAPEEAPQTEQSRFRPRSAYGISKLAGFELTRNYREQYGLFAANGILYNHESPRRGYEYVTRKITHGAARIKLGLANQLKLGNLEAKRDWGHAKDYVRAMWLMLQQNKPDDFIVATGITHSVRDFAAHAFAFLDLDYTKYVITDPNLVRPKETCQLVGNAEKAKSVLYWKPEISFEAMIQEMIKNDLALLERQTS